jgi:hypothetical protein
MVFLYPRSGFTNHLSTTLLCPWKVFCVHTGFKKYTDILDSLLVISKHVVVSAVF